MGVEVHSTSSINTYNDVKWRPTFQQSMTMFTCNILNKEYFHLHLNQDIFNKRAKYTSSATTASRCLARPSGNHFRPIQGKWNLSFSLHRYIFCFFFSFTMLLLNLWTLIYAFHGRHHGEEMPWEALMANVAADIFWRMLRKCQQD